MKNVKKMLVMLLAVAMLAAAMLTPASAASGNDSFTGVNTGFGYSADGTLTLANKSAGATLKLTRIAGQSVAAIAELKIEGRVFVSSPVEGQTVSNPLQATVSDSLSCSANTTTTRPTTGAKVTYSVNYKDIKTLEL